VNITWNCGEGMLLPQFEDAIEYDKVTSRHIHSVFQQEALRYKVVYYIAKILTLSADGILWFPIPPLVFILVGQFHFGLLTESSSYRWFFELYVGCVLCACIELVLKPIFGRSRPLLPTNETQRFIKAENYSFPSGHTMRAFYIAACVGLQSWGWGFVFLFWALFVGVSRVIVGRHFMLDTIGGAFAGIVVQCMLVLSGFVSIACDLIAH